MVEGTKEFKFFNLFFEKCSKSRDDMEPKKNVPLHTRNMVCSGTKEVKFFNLFFEKSSKPRECYGTNKKCRTALKKLLVCSGTKEFKFLKLLVEKCSKPRDDMEPKIGCPIAHGKLLVCSGTWEIAWEIARDLFFGKMLQIGKLIGNHCSRNVPLHTWNVVCSLKQRKSNFSTFFLKKCSKSRDDMEPKKKSHCTPEIR